MISELIGLLGRSTNFFSITMISELIGLLGLSLSASPCLLFKNYGQLKPIFSLGGSGSMEQPSAWPRLPVESRSLAFEGCDNGVICLTDLDSSAVYLWNPHLRHLKKLPEDDRGSPTFLCGLVHVPASDDLAVVRLSRPDPDGGGDPFYNLFTRGTSVSVYSLKTDSWREIPFPPLLDPTGTRLEKPHTQRRCSVVVAGRVHWSFIYLTADPDLFPAPESFSSGSIHSFGIVAFDPNDESFSMMDPPVGGCDLVRPFFVSHVGELHGSLSLIASLPELGRCEVWVMKEYGVVGSWTKQFSVDTVFVSETLQPPYSGQKIRAIGLANNGYVLFRSRVGLFCYNLKTQTVEYYCSDSRVREFITEYVPTGCALY